MVDENGDDVGYKRPPKNRRFRKGQSGNPSGRPKGVKNIATIIDKVCRAPVRVNGEDGRPYSMPMIEAIIRRLMAAAAKGDYGATRMCFGILKMFPQVMETPSAASPKFVISFVKSEYEKSMERVAQGRPPDDETGDPIEEMMEMPL